MGIPVIGDIIDFFGQKAAANDEIAAAKQAQAQQQQVYGQNSANYQPWIQGGQQSLAQLLAGLQSGAFQANVNPQNLANDPGYQFQLQQGMQALQRSAAAKGGLNSGGFMKGLDQYSQGLAGAQFQNAWNRSFQQGQANYQNLAGATGMGLNATQGLGGLGQGYANAMSGLYGAIGNANAGKDLAFSNAANGILSSASGLGMMGGGGGGGAPQMNGFNFGIQGAPGYGYGAQTGYIPPQGYQLGGGYSQAPIPLADTSGALGAGDFSSLGGMAGFA